MKSHYVELNELIHDRIRPRYLPERSSLKWTSDMYQMHLAIKKLLWQRLKLEFPEFRGKNIDTFKYIKALEILDEIAPKSLFSVDVNSVDNDGGSDGR